MMKGNLVVLMGILWVQLFTVESAEPQCGDVCFAIDGSGSIRKLANFQIETQQVVEIVEILQGISNNVEYSALVFGTGLQSIRVVSQLTSDSNAFIDDVAAQPFESPRGTPMDRAIESCNELLAEGDPTRPKTIVLLTDGRPNNATATRDAAMVVRDAGVRLITVGFVSPGIRFLTSIASESSSGTPLSYNSAEIDIAYEIIRQIAFEVCRGPCQIACEECDMQFQGEDCTPVYTVPTTPDQSFTPKIVMKDGMRVIGIVNSNNLPPEFIDEEGVVTNVQEFDIPGQHYSRSQFKPFDIRPNSRMSGIGHQRFQTEAQRKNAEDKCVRVFFSSYQILDPETRRVIENVNNVRTKGTNCVVFRTAA